MKKEHSAGIILCIKDDAQARLYLLLHYPRGYWDFPKGKLEEGETPLEAALREVKEETGLTADIYEGFTDTLKYLYKNPHGEMVDKTVTYFVGHAHSREIVLSDEHIGSAWLSYTDAKKQLTYLTAHHVLSAAEQFLEIYDQ